jgi:RimJ/RimL family protein N-acetyltransferase
MRSVKRRLISKRLYYKTLKVDDVSDAYVAWMNDREINKFLESRFLNHTRKSISNFVHEAENNPFVDLFGIYDRTTNVHIGNIKVDYTNRCHNRGDIGLIIGEKNFWGKGLATEAIREITLYGFNDIGLDKISAGCFESNIGSLKAFKNVGYVVEGVLRKHGVSYNNVREDGVILGILLGEISHEK